MEQKNKVLIVAVIFLVLGILGVIQKEIGSDKNTPDRSDLILSMTKYDYCRQLSSTDYKCCTDLTTAYEQANMTMPTDKTVYNCNMVNLAVTEDSVEVIKR